MNRKPKAIIEGILFASGDSVSLKRLSEVLDMSEGKINVEKYGELIAMEEAQATFEGLSDGSKPTVKYIYDMSK